MNTLLLRLSVCIDYVSTKLLFSYHNFYVFFSLHPLLFHSKIEAINNLMGLFSMHDFDERKYVNIVYAAVVFMLADFDVRN